MRQVSKAKLEKAQEIYRQIQDWKARGREAVESNNTAAAERCLKHVTRLLARLETFGKTGKL